MIESQAHGEKHTNSRKNNICGGERLEVRVKLLQEWNTEQVWTHETGAGTEDCVG